MTPDDVRQASERLRDKGEGVSETGELASEAEAMTEEGERESTGEALALAQVAVRQAEQRLWTAQAALPLAQQAVETARAVVLAKEAECIVWQEALRIGALPPDEAGLVAARERDMWEASRRLREAKARVAALPQAIKQAEAGIRTARQQAFVAEHYPALVQALAEVQASEPTDSDEAGASYRARAIWRQQVAEVRGRISNIIAQAGL